MLLIIDSKTQETSLEEKQHPQMLRLGQYWRFAYLLEELGLCAQPPDFSGGKIRSGNVMEMQDAQLQGADSVLKLAEDSAAQTQRAPASWAISSTT
jgi:hypothetical protein